MTVATYHSGIPNGDCCRARRGCDWSCLQPQELLILWILVRWSRHVAVRHCRRRAHVIQSEFVIIELLVLRLGLQTTGFPAKTSKLSIKHKQHVDKWISLGKPRYFVEYVRPNFFLVKKKFSPNFFLNRSNRKFCIRIYSVFNIQRNIHFFSTLVS